MNYKVVFQISNYNDESLKKAYNQFTNASEMISIQHAEFVFHGDAVKFLAGSLASDALLEKLSNHAHVRLVACVKALAKAGITQTSLHTKISIVQSGVGHIIIRQTEGYAYIKID